MKKYSLAIIFILMIVLVLSGCTETIKLNTPYIKDLYAQPDSIAKGDSFKVFFTINNPTGNNFEPFVKIKYDSNEFQPQDYTVGKNEVLKLKSVPRYEEKSFYLEFSAKSYSSAGNYKFEMALYDSDDSLAPLGEVKQDIVKIVEGALQ